jgi:hypothetical protein
LLFLQIRDVAYEEGGHNSCEEGREVATPAAALAVNLRLRHSLPEIKTRMSAFRPTLDSLQYLDGGVKATEHYGGDNDNRYPSHHPFSTGHLFVLVMPDLIGQALKHG